MGDRLLVLLVFAMVVGGPVAGAVGATDGRTTGAITGPSARADATAAPTELSSCTTITEPGRYVLASDVANESAGICIRIRSSDVVLDGNGHAVEGEATIDAERLADRFFRRGANPFRQPTSIGVAVAADRPLSNVTVRDLTVSDWRWGVVASRLSDGNLERVNATGNGYGIAAFRSPGVTVADSVAVESAVFGVGLYGSARTTVENVVASQNGVMGVYQIRGREVTVSNVTARNNDLAGILLDRTRAATVRDSAVSDNRFGVYLARGSGGRVSGVTAVRNGVAGIYASNATEPRVTDSVATNNSLAGVLLDGTVGASVTTTNASRNRYGIYVFRADDTRVTESTGNDGVIGVYVRNATNGSVLNNTVLGNSFDGVFVENSTGIRVADNRDGAVTFESTGNETIGEEGGYEHDETIEVNQSDGLSAEERRAYVYRTIARAEHLRRLEFTGSMSFEVISQAEFGRRNAAEPDPTATVSAWRDQLWEATFVVGEDRNATQIVQNESSNVAGFYNAYADKMTIVSDTDPLTVSSTTLVHEFVHALQDQHFDLTRSELRSRTEDGSRARSGLIEGDARYVEERFEQLCGVFWNCVQVESKEPPGGDIEPGRNFAIRQMILAPYSDGPSYVERLRKQGGWEAVDDAYANPPNTTEQVLHPERRNEPPIPLSFEDTARGGWEKFDQQNLSFSGVNGTTTVGEVGIFTMFWYQGYEYGNPIVGVERHLYPNDPTFDLFNYTSAPSAGWGNDVLVPYRNGNRSGYVWKTVWDTETDAREFRRAYVQLLGGHGAEKVGPNTWVVDSGPFADAFRVVRRDAGVTVVNAPTVAALDDLRPGLAGNASATQTDDRHRGPT